MAQGNGQLPVEITYEVDGESVAKRFALLVVACDPRRLAIADPTPTETEVNDRLLSYTFHTTLMKAVCPPGTRHAERFNHDSVQNGASNVSFYRDEVRVRLGEDERAAVIQAGGDTLVTTCQFSDEPMPWKKSPEAFARRVEELEAVLEMELADDWYGFVDCNFEKPLARHLVDYFPHFKLSGLIDELPWAVVDAQGANATLYVSAFACFESILHIHAYGEQLWGLPQVQAALPAAKDAPIAVVGAGPSGLLFASQQLQKKGGYTNVTLLEKSDRIGGQTLTVNAMSPLPGMGEIACEMGTWYLTTAHEPIIRLIEEYDAGELYPMDGDDFRGIVAGNDKTANNREERYAGIPFWEWVKRRNGGVDIRTDETLLTKLLGALTKYRFVHRAIMGVQRPIPLKKPLPPTRNKLGLDINMYLDVFKISIHKFFKKYDMVELLPFVTYLYELGGYGDVEGIAVYYGLIWITPELLDAVLEAWLPISDRKVGFFGLTKGWSELWKQIEKKDKLNVVKNVNIKKITRS